VRRLLALLPALALVASLVSLANGNASLSTGPPASRTGAPAIGGVVQENLCTMCHSDFAPNNPNGSLQILDLPDWYSPGITYRLRARLASTANAAAPDRRWGFELTAVQASNGQGVGTFAVRGNQVGGVGGDTLRIVSGTGVYSTRRYVEHLYEGTQFQQPSPVEWSFSWTAPAGGVGTVYFFAAGNAADGSGDPSGDWIYTTADSMRDTTTATVARSWGAIKRQWR
jgi:hypothetical protein